MTFHKKPTLTSCNAPSPSPLPWFFMSVSMPPSVIGQQPANVQRLTRSLQSRRLKLR